MQAFSRLGTSTTHNVVIRCQSAASAFHTAQGGLMENVVATGIKATVGHAVKKVKQAVGAEKQTAHATMEPAGVMENRDPSEEGQPQARYKELAEKGKANFPGNSVTDLYQDSKKNAEATAESAKTKAAENRNPIS